MIDWTRPLTLCWCGFEFYGVQHAHPHLNALAETINEMHLGTHQIEARTAQLHKRRERVEEFIRSIPHVEYVPNIIAGNNDLR